MKKSQEPKDKSQRNIGKVQAPNTGSHARRQSAPWTWRFELGALLVGLLCFLPFGVPAQTNLSVLSSNRYLLIVETSRSMEGRGSGTLQAIHQLLASAMRGELRKGDSFGIWTYNSQLYTGRFPIQYWSPETQKSIVQKAMVFLQAQTCEKTGNLELVLPTLERVAKNSQLLTVILVSDGEQKIRGTGFDEQINKLYDHWRTEQTKAKMPFITILRSFAGQWTNFTVNPAPWPVEMPPMPKSLEVAKVEKKPTATKPPLPPRSTNNLIISGRKIAESKLAASNTLPINPTETASSPGPVPGSPGTAQAGTISSQGIANEAPAPSVASANPTSSLVQPASSAPSPVPRAEVISTAPAPPPVQSEKLSVPSPRDSAPVNTPPVPQVVSGKIESEPATKTAPVLETPPVQPAVTEGAGSVANAEQASKTELSAHPAPRPGVSKRVQADAATVAVVQDSWFKNGTTLAVSGLLLFVGIGAIAFLWAQRSRSAKHASLITRSLDRKEP
jgi:hypothetical protein